VPAATRSAIRKRTARSTQATSAAISAAVIAGSDGCAAPAALATTRIEAVSGTLRARARFRGLDRKPSAAATAAKAA
jgi:hypothetical protein